VVVIRHRKEHKALETTDTKKTTQESFFLLAYVYICGFEIRIEAVDDTNCTD
jgi:hypothetical protein